VTASGIYAGNRWTRIDQRQSSCNDTDSGLSMNTTVDSFGQRSSKRSFAKPWLDAALAEALYGVAQSGSCPNVCPLARPLCVNGECVPVQCAQVKHYCSLRSAVGETTRRICPETCECHRIGSPLLFPYSKDGCHRCSWFETATKGAFSSLPCADKNVSHADFGSILAGLADSNATGPLIATDGRMLAGSDVALIQALGCSQVPKVRACDIQGTKPLSLFCPGSCGCVDGSGWSGCSLLKDSCYNGRI
jgi:hypothetical protein